MKLCEMAQEYRVNVALLELRIKQLQAAQKRTRQPEVRYRLKQCTWAPILEVAALFIGIFLAMVPALDFLRRIAPTLPLNELTMFVFPLISN